MFTPLHVYTGSSFLKSGLKVNEYVKAAKKAGFTNLAISDFSTLRGAPEFTKLCKANQIKPIIGEDFLIDDLLVSFFVKNETGYANLLKLSFLNQKGQLSFEEVRQFNDGLIVILPITSVGFVAKFAPSEDFARYLVKLQRGIKDFYIGLDVLSEDYFYLNKVRTFMVDHCYELVAFPSIKYLKNSDAITLRMVEAIEKDIQIEEHKLSGNEYLKTEIDLEKDFTKEEIECTNKIAEQINFELVIKRGKLIHYENNLGMTSDEYLHHLVKVALKSKGLLNKHSYVDRAKYELDVISKMGYSDYFLLVMDYVNWAKKQGILVGPGRGSGPASLIAYCLNITSADPIKYNLVFERFLNIDRQTMPDIDIDFPDVDRGLVFNYLRDKYGKDHVANILAVQTIGPRQSIRDVGRIYKYEDRDIEMISKMIDPMLSLRENYKHTPKFKELIDSDKYYLEIVSLASKIEGLPRQASLHAAGVVLNAEPLEQVAPVSIDSEGNYVEEYEKDYLEEQAFLKMDLLGIRNLTIIDECLKRIKNDLKIDLKYEELPFDDEKAIAMIASTKTMGLFQLESTGMRNAIKTLKPSTFEDVVALLALYRPGPMENIPHYAKRKQGKEAITYLSPALKEILEPTYGIIVYQEQIIQIANKMAGFTMGQADIFRSAISKKKADKLASLHDDFIKGCIKNGYSQKEANDVYNHIYKFADYGFNRSHSLVYAIVSCQMAYLKTYYPEQFYASILDNSYSAGTASFNSIISEMKALHIKMSVPSINESDTLYQIKDKTLVFPLSAIKGIHSNIVISIIKERNENGLFKDIFDFVIRMSKYKINNITIKKLIDAGAMDCFNAGRSALLMAIIPAIQYAAAINDENGQLVLDISLLPKPVLRETTEDPVMDLNNEYETLGIMLSGSPLTLVKEKTNKLNITNIIDVQSLHGNVKIAAIIRSVKIIRNKKGEQMAFVDIYDDSGEMEITVFSDVYLVAGTYLKKNQIVIITGYNNPNKEKFNFSVQQIERLEDIE